MNRLPRVGILGGTFDPIHVGHLAAGLAARAALDLDSVVLVPAHDPPHRAAEPCASGAHRFAMAALAIDAVAGLVLSDMELAAGGPSFTATTMRRLHGRGFEPAALFFITGSDAFAEIASWRDYRAILDSCHFVVISRPGWPLSALGDRLPDLAPRMRTTGAGGAQAGDPVDASLLSIFLVDSPTPDVSSTGIRDRVRDGLPISGLVPPSVERYIQRHGLYGSVGDVPAATR
jgi:nicotinate-nucleotide adenylyltransferase